MTEPKVVHEWEDGETEYKLLLDGSLRWEQVDIGSRSICEGSVTPSSITKELARLAARVQELEEKHEDSEYRNVHLEKVVDDQQAENTQLREALERIEAVRRTNKWPDKVVVKEMEHISRSALKEKP